MSYSVPRQVLRENTMINNFKIQQLFFVETFDIGIIINIDDKGIK